MTPRLRIALAVLGVLVVAYVPLFFVVAQLAHAMCADAPAREASLVALVALYMGVFALVLAAIAYVVLTRLFVRPLEGMARAADRTRAQLEGSERLASVGKLAAGVAHEVGNPIAAILGMHDLLEDETTPPDVQRDFLRRMRKETERVSTVVRDLLDYARPETLGPQEPEGSSAVASVAEAVSDALALVRPQKTWRNIGESVELAEGLTAAISPQRLTQVLLNLLLNAAAVAPQVIRVRGERASGGLTRIAVEDDGPGVPPAMREHIFDPFVTTKEVGAGTGLGLSVCRGIVEAAGGRVYVDPAYTEGARFVVELPAS